MIKSLFVFFSIMIVSPVFSQTQDIYPRYDDNATYSSDALNRLYIVGLQYLNSGDLTQAEISFRSIIAFPYRSKDWRTSRYYKGKAHYYLGDVYFIQKKYDKATVNYQIVAQEYAEIEEYSSTLYKLGRSLILDKKEMQGIEVLKDYTYNYGTKDKFADNALYWIAQGHISLQDYISALKILHQILRDFPNSGMAYNIRMLITKLETSVAPVSLELQQNINTSVNQNQKIVDKIEKEKELVDRIKQLLSLKEKLLSLKERKLNLLESIGKTRVSALKEKNISIPN